MSSGREWPVLQSSHAGAKIQLQPLIFSPAVTLSPRGVSFHQRPAKTQMQGGERVTAPIICFEPPKSRVGPFHRSHANIHVCSPGKLWGRLPGLPSAFFFTAVSPRCGSLGWGLTLHTDFLPGCAFHSPNGDGFLSVPNWKAMLGNNVRCAANRADSVYNKKVRSIMTYVGEMSTGSVGREPAVDVTERDRTTNHSHPPALSCPLRLRWASTLSQRN